MKIFRRLIIYTTVLGLRYLAFALLIPPVQSSPETKLTLFPSIVFALALFIAGSLCQYKYTKSDFHIIIADTFMIFILGWLFLTRVKSGVF